MKKNIEFASLKTPFEANMGDIPFSEYPRPALKRDSYICLNGKWEFTVCKKGDAAYAWVGQGNIHYPCKVLVQKWLTANNAHLTVRCAKVQKLKKGVCGYICLFVRYVIFCKAVGAP